MASITAPICGDERLWWALQSYANDLKSIGAFTSIAGLSITVHEVSRVALKSSQEK